LALHSVPPLHWLWAHIRPEYAPMSTATGRMCYALRITTNHYGDPMTRPCGALLKWGR
jgi:hypothetical protein